MTTTATLHELHNPKRQRGLSLVELMISLVISMILLAGLTTLIVQQSQTRDELEKSSRQIENGRYAMQILHDDIQHAGFYGQYFILPAPPAAMPDPCLTAPLTGPLSLTEAMPLVIQGYNSAAASPITCIDNANFLPGTDILVIRRANSSYPTANPSNSPYIAAAAAGAGGQVYLQTNTSAAVMGVGAGASTTSFPLAYDTANTIRAPLRSYLVHVYFVSPCSSMANGATCTASDDNGRPIPTLKRLELSANGGATTFTLIPLVEGIENMQLDYGLDADKDGYPDVYSAAPASTTDWANVMTVSVNLLARNNDPTTGYADTKSYTLGNNAAIAAPAAAINYKRHVFSELVRAVNPIGRRAQQ